MNVDTDKLHHLVRLALISFLVGGLAVAPLQAQEETSWEVFRAAGSAGGPAADAITSLLVDGGTVWVGTPQGLSRYDGGAWDTFRTGDPQLDDVQALTLDRRGNLWVGTAGGLLLLGPRRRWDDRRRLADDLSQINVLRAAREGGVWIGSLRGATYWPPSADDAEGQRLDLLPDENVLALWQEEDGDVWLGTESGRVIHSRPDGSSQTYAQDQGLSGTRVYALWGDAQGDLWVGTLEGACRLSRVDPQARCRPVEPLRDLVVNGFFPAAEGSVWVATTVGAWRLRGQQVLETIQPTVETTLRRDQVRAVAQDSEGQLWLATSGGLARRRAQIWESLLPAPDTPDLLAKDVRAVAEDAQGKLWVGTARGLKQRDPSGAWHSVAAVAERPVECLASDGQGGLWLCLDGELARLTPAGQIESLADDQGPWDARLSTLQRAPDGSLWLVTAPGAIWRWEGAASWRQGVNWQRYLDGGAKDLTFDGASHPWVSTLSGLSHFDGERWTDWGWEALLAQTDCSVTGTALPDARDETLIFDDRGRLWIGTRVGLMRFHDGEVRCWDTTHNLVADHVRGLTLQGTTLWIGTFEGLGRADLAAETVSQLPLTQFVGASLPHDFVQALHFSPQQGMLVGTPNGLWAYRPSPAPPQVRLRHVPAGQVAHDTLREPELPLELAHDAPAALFALGGDLRTPDGDLGYRFRIDAGAQRRELWSANPTVPVADLLPPGETISITAWALDRDFNLSPQAAELSVTRRSVPLLNRPWFLILLGTLLVGGTVGLSRAARLWRLYGYHDLELNVKPASASGAHAVQLTARRRLTYWFWGPLQRDGVLFRRLFSLRPSGDPAPSVRALRFYGVAGRYERTLDPTALDDPLERLRADRTDESSLRSLGQQLYEALFSPEATTLLRQHLGFGQEGVRLRLRFDSEMFQLAALPWEFLHGGDPLGFLNVSADVALVRDLSAARQEKVSRARKPLKVLVAWASPEEDWLSRLDVTAEVEAIRSAFAPLVAAGDAELQVLPHARLETFRQQVQRGYDLIHFSGHGGVEQGEGVLYLEDEDGYALPLTQKALVTLLTEAPTVTDKTPKLILLNACRTADPGTIESLMGLAAALVREGRLPAAVGMGYAIATGSAAIFAQAFYEALAPYGQADYAVAKGREALSVEVGAEYRDWGVPRLYTRMAGGVIFDRT